MNDKCVGVVSLKFWGVIEHARAYIHMVLLNLLHLGTQNAIVYQKSGTCMMHHKLYIIRLTVSLPFHSSFHGPGGLSVYTSHFIHIGLQWNPCIANCSSNILVKCPFSMKISF